MYCCLSSPFKITVLDKTYFQALTLCKHACHTLLKIKQSVFAEISLRMHELMRPTTPLILLNEYPQDQNIDNF